VQPAMPQAVTPLLSQTHDRIQLTFPALVAIDKERSGYRPLTSCSPGCSQWPLSEASPTLFSASPRRAGQEIKAAVTLFIATSPTNPRDHGFSLLSDASCSGVDQAKSLATLICCGLNDRTPWVHLAPSEKGFVNAASVL
jgi:hypothetical protein